MGTARRDLTDLEEKFQKFVDTAENGPLQISLIFIKTYLIKTYFSMFALITLLINTQKFKKMCHCLAAYWETRMLDFFVVPLRGPPGAILAIMGQQKNQACVPRQTMMEIFRSIPSFKIDQNWSRCSCISSACRSCPENMKKPSKSAFFRFFDYKIFISYQDGPKCTKWPTWPLVVCGVCRAYVVFISNTWSVRQLTFKWSCSQFLLNFGNLENTVEPV